MNILHVGPKTFPPAHGGVEKIVFDIVNGVHDFQSYIFVEWPQAETDYVKVLPKGIYRQFVYICKFMKENKISTAHFHKEAFIPHALISSLYGVKTIITLHGVAWRLRRWKWYFRIAFYLLDVLACIFVWKVVFVGQEDYRHFSRIIFWRKLFYLPNGIESNSSIGECDVDKCIYIGRVSPEKNISSLIDLFRSGSKKLTIYGPFDKHDRAFEARIGDEISSCPNVAYGGVLRFDEIVNTLSRYNTFYNISFSEGMPVSVLEAASVGLNLVLSDIPAHRDLIFPDVIYVDPYAPKMKGTFEGISDRNKAHVESTFSLKQTIDGYKIIYLEANSTSG